MAVASDRIVAFGKDISKLMEMLTDKEIARAMRSSLRAEASRVKREAGKLLKAEKYGKADPKRRREKMHKVAHGAALAKTITSGVTKDGQGYYVAARPSGKKAMHLNRRGLLKPVAYYLNRGRKDLKAANFIGRADQSMERSLRLLNARFEDFVAKIISKKFSV